MKPIVEINIKGKTYTLEATFDLFSEVERITGIGLFAILSNPTSLRLEWISQILYPSVKEDMSQDELKEFIMKDYPYVFEKIITLLSVGFDNPNPEAKQLKESQTKDDPVKKN